MEQVIFSKPTAEHDLELVASASDLHKLVSMRYFLIIPIHSCRPIRSILRHFCPTIPYTYHASPTIPYRYIASPHHGHTGIHPNFVDFTTLTTLGNPYKQKSSLFHNNSKSPFHPS
jgi:hypothetical protein